MTCLQWLGIHPSLIACGVAVQKKSSKLWSVWSCLQGAVWPWASHSCPSTEYPRKMKELDLGFWNPSFTNHLRLRCTAAVYDLQNSVAFKNEGWVLAHLTCPLCPLPSFSGAQNNQAAVPTRTLQVSGQRKMEPGTRCGLRRLLLGSGTCHFHSRFIDPTASRRVNEVGGCDPLGGEAPGRVATDIQNRSSDLPPSCLHHPVI